MFEALEEINARPAPFQFYTARELWTDPHTTKQMLKYHLDESVDAASRNKNFIIEASRTRVVYNWLQYYSPDTLARKFEENGFTIENLYANVAGTVFSSDTLEIAVVAKKL